MKRGCVYKITSPTNRIYIGSSSNIEKRFSNYRSYDCKSQRKLYNSLKKYGWQLHIFEIIWEGPLEEMFEQEALLGLKFNVLDVKNLNCKLPKHGEIFSCISEETRNKMKASIKKAYETMSDEKRNLLGKKKIGQRLSEESVEKRTNKVQKPVIQLDLGNNIIREWDSAVKASKILKISSSDICQCCKNKKNSCGGFKWKYLNEELEELRPKYKKRKDTDIKNKKPIIQMDLNEIFIREWNSIADVCRELNISGSHISSCCYGKRNTAHNFKWKHKVNENIS